MRRPSAQYRTVSRFGGIADIVAAQLQDLTGKESRTIVLGHLLRGGPPTAMDRNLGVTLGAGAVYALSKGMTPDGIPLADIEIRSGNLFAVSINGVGGH